MEAGAQQFHDLMNQLEDLTDQMTPERALADFDQTTLQLFWMRWPHLSAWTGALWRMLSEELTEPGSPHRDGDLDEVGGSD